MWIDTHKQIRLLSKTHLAKDTVREPFVNARFEEL